MGCCIDTSADLVLVPAFDHPPGEFALASTTISTTALKKRPSSAKLTIGE